MTEIVPPDLSVERIEELQAQCRNAFDLPQIKLSELSALLSLAHSAASGSEKAGQRFSCDHCGGDCGGCGASTKKEPENDDPR